MRRTSPFEASALMNCRESATWGGQDIWGHELPHLLI